MLEYNHTVGWNVFPFFKLITFILLSVNGWMCGVRDKCVLAWIPDFIFGGKRTTFRSLFFSTTT